MGIPVKKPDSEFLPGTDLLQVFFDNAADAAWLLDAAGKIHKFNQSAESLLGPRAQGMIGLPLIDFVEEEPGGVTEGDFNNVHDFKKLMLKGLLRNAFTHFLTRPGGKIPVLISTYEVSGSVLVIAHDLSDVIDMEQRLVETRRQLAVSGFKATSTLTAGFAHEINNPLTVVIGRLRQIESVLHGQIIKGADLEKMVKGAIKAADRVSGLVSQLRTAYGDSPNEQRTLFGLAHLISISIARYEQEVRKSGIRLMIDCNKDLSVFASQSIATAIGNVIENAIFWCGGVDNPYISIDTRLRENSVSIIIRNNGKPIPDDDASKIFEPFFTTRDIGQGMGLGLAVSRCILDQLGGSIELLESGTHTTFELRLPTRRN